MSIVWLTLGVSAVGVPAILAKSQPTLARLSIWSEGAPADSVRDAFEGLLAPVLATHGLIESPLRPRATPRAVTSWLYAVDSPLRVPALRDSLTADPAWSSALKAASERLLAESRSLDYRFEVYQAPFLHPEPAARLPGRGYWRAFTEADGLASGAVRAIAQDHDGRLWLAVGSGLARFDGQTFEMSTVDDGLPSGIVQALLVDRAGTLWLGTTEGLSRRGRDGWETVSVGNVGEPSDVWDLLEDRQGRLWVSTAHHGVAWLEDGVWQHLSTANGRPIDTALSVTQSADGAVWIGTFGEGVFRYHDGRLDAFTVADGLAQNSVRCVLGDRDGRVWVGTWTNGVSVFEAGRWRTLRRGSQDTDGIWNIAEDGQGNLWMTSDSAVSRLRLRSLQSDELEWATYTKLDGLGVSLGRGLHASADGTVWVGSAEGLARYSDSDALTYDGEHGLRASVLAPAGMYVDTRDRVWLLSMQDGANRWDGAAWRTYSTEHGLPSSAVVEMAEDSAGDLWFATLGGGVARCGGDTCETFSAADGLPGNSVHALAWTSIGLVAGAYGEETGGAALFAGGNWNRLWSDAIRDDDVFWIEEDDRRRLWFGTNTTVARYDPRADPASAWLLFTGREGQPESSVLQIARGPDGCMWFTTMEGIRIYCEDASGAGDWRRLTPAHGLAGNWVNALALDRHGRMWIGSTGGLNVTDGRVMQRLGRKDGLAGNFVGAVVVDGHGDVWAASMRDGVTRLVRPSADAPPAIRLSGVSVAGQRYQPATAISTAHSEAACVFEFRASDFATRPGGLVYRYRLVGHHDDWRATSATSVEYLDLPRGDYRFEVQAVGRALSYSDPVRVDLTIHFPYGQLALRGSLALALALGAWQTFRLVRRGRELRATNHGLAIANSELLERGAQLARANEDVRRATEAKSSFLADMSHEIRTPLNSILGFAELLQSDTEANLGERQISNLERIHRNATGLLSLIDQALDLAKIEAGGVDVDLREVTVREIIDDARATILPLLEGKPVVCHVHCADDALSVVTDPDKLRRVLINLLSNAAKFTSEGQIVVDAREEGNGLRIEVSDTGVGIGHEDMARVFQEFVQVGTTGTRGSGLGLAIARRLCEMLGGEIRVQSQVGRGSTFTVWLPATSTRADTVVVSG